MATTEGIGVDETQNQIRIEDLTIHDVKLVEILAGTDPGDRKDIVVQALRIGASALEMMETSKEAEIVEQRFQEMENEFDDRLSELREELESTFGDDGELMGLMEDHLGDDGRLVTHLEETFGEDGRFVDRLEAELGENGEMIQEALNPNKKGTPTHQLKQDIRELREEIVAEEAKEEVRKETRFSGYDFEDQLEELLRDVVRQTPNRVENTSEKTGELSGKKKGDFVVTLDETGQRIVIEAKNGDFDETVEDEMEIAIENRDADYGILVASSLEYLPRTRVGWFSEIDTNYLIVALSENSDDEIEPRFLKFAYHWARTRTLLSAVEVTGETDTEAIKGELDGIQDSVEDFSQIRTQCSNLEDSVESIRDHLREIEDSVMTGITQIENELGVTD